MDCDPMDVDPVDARDYEVVAPLEESDDMKKLLADDGMNKREAISTIPDNGFPAISFRESGGLSDDDRFIIRSLYANSRTRHINFPTEAFETSYTSSEYKFWFGPKEFHFEERNYGISYDNLFRNIIDSSDEALISAVNHSREMFR